MSKQTEALQLALEAFEESGILWKMDKAHKAVKEALKEPSWVGLTEQQKLFLEIQGSKADVMLAELVEKWLKAQNT